MKPAASGDKYDFTEPRKFSVIAEDGVTSKDCTVTIRADSASAAGNIFESGDYKKWKSYVTHNSDGSVFVQVEIPMSANVVPEAVSADTTGFTESSVSFLITDGNGKLIRDYSLNSSASNPGSGGTRGADKASYVLTFMAVSPTEAAYESAKILSIRYWLDGESYIQTFGSGVTVARDTTIETNDYVTDTTETGDTEQSAQSGSSSGGGCDAGALAVMALAIGVGVLALAKNASNTKLKSKA